MMADITMCTNTGCPNAPHCYRFQAKPSDHWQSYALFRYTIGARVNCKEYWPMYKAVLRGDTLPLDPVP